MSPPPPSPSPAPVEYTVNLASRTAHLYTITARFPAHHPTTPFGTPTAFELRLPTWTPGSYLIREYQRHLQDLTCTDEHDQPLPVTKIAKSRWRVEAGAAQTVVAHYRVYAHEVTVRTLHLDDTHAFWNGAPLFLYVEPLRDRPCRVTIEAPTGWHVSTALSPEAADPLVLHAADYDEIVDSPVEVGTHERIDFTAAERPVSIAIWGRLAFDRQRLQDDLAAIIESQAALFGPPPYDRYTFILHLAPGAYGGLEHKRSSTLLSSPFSFTNEKRYHDFLELASHEFFHLWNGKRIRPAALGPFDYQSENYTRSLWVVEGWTSYYDRLFLRRSRRISAARFREKLGEDLTRLFRIPGRGHQSLEESSFDAWIKLYRPDENSVNTTVSYYLKGSVVALLLDLEIRARTDGKRSLDDALRLLWARFLADGKGYGDDEVQPIVEEASGVSLDDFFASAVRGRGDVDLEGPLATVGCKLRRTFLPPVEEGKEPSWLGATLAQQGDRLRVTESIEGGPAQAAGLSPGDEVVAWDGYRIDDAAVKERLAITRPGATCRLAIFRRDELREITVTLGKRPWDKIEVIPLPAADEAARTAYAKWMLEDWKIE